MQFKTLPPENENESIETDEFIYPDQIYLPMGSFDSNTCLHMIRFI